MWCTTCRQDVPGIASEKPATFSCARCGHAITIEPMTLDTSTIRDEPQSVDDDPVSQSSGDGSHTCDPEPWADSTQSGPPIDLDHWQFDDDVRGAEHTLAMTARISGTGRPSSLSDTRFSPQKSDSARSGEAINTPNFGGRDLDVSSFDARNSSVRRPTTGPSLSVQDDRKHRSGLLAWCVLLVGIMAFVCGGVLLGWSFFEGHQQLWNLGLPITIAGQATLLIGLMLQVEQIWHNSRRASERLLHVDRQLNDLQQTTAILGNTHGVASNAFYSHMAEGANPHLLLADLKGQLDMLAVKVAQRD